MGNIQEDNIRKICVTCDEETEHKVFAKYNIMDAHLFDFTICNVCDAHRKVK